MNYIRLVLAAAAIILSLTLISTAQELKKDEPASQITATAPATPAGHDHGSFKEKRFVATVGPDGVQHVEITGGGYFFDPNVIVVKANVPVELSVKKEKGYVPHDIVVKASEAGIDFAVELKEKPQVIQFTPTRPGTYEMYCSKKVFFMKSHKDRGMDGFIEVVQ